MLWGLLAHHPVQAGLHLLMRGVRSRIRSGHQGRLLHVLLSSELCFLRRGRSCETALLAVAGGLY